MRLGLALNFALIFVCALTVGLQLRWAVTRLSVCFSEWGCRRHPRQRGHHRRRLRPLPSKMRLLSGGRVQDSYVYEVRFLVRELGGRSGAIIKWITVHNPNLRAGESTSTQHQSESCWRTELRVPPGGTLDTFYTDAGSAWLSYCWVGIDALPGASSFPIEVFFKDDYGYEGSVKATALAHDGR
jgi:hypothetical protein